jgi:hypothetical protein
MLIYCRIKLTEALPSYQNDPNSNTPTAYQTNFIMRFASNRCLISPAATPLQMNLPCFADVS